MVAACLSCQSAIPSGAVTCPSCGWPVAAMPTPRELPVGTQLQNGKYSVGRKLGEGGFAITYRGAQKHLRRIVAIKEMFPEGAVRQGKGVFPRSNEKEYRRERDKVLQEAQVVARLESRGIVRVYDTFLENNTAYIVMEYLDGPTLSGRIEQQGGPLPVQEVKKIAIDLCVALKAIHSNGLLHRDIKPENIILSKDGRTVLIDFGTARRFQQGKTVAHTRMLTVDYAAPEQYQPAAKFGAYTDIYCLGATLYHAMTGTVPASSMERFQALAQAPDKPLSISFSQLPQGAPVLIKALCMAIQVAMEMKPENRPQDMDAFRRMFVGPRPPGLPSKTPATAIAPYRFNGRRYSIPQELIAALEKDWAIALRDWKAAGLGKWVSDAATRKEHLKAINEALDGDPIFAMPNYYGSAIDTGRFRMKEAVGERRLRRALAVLDPSWPPSYRGRRIGNQYHLKEWVADAKRGGEQSRILERCIKNGFLLSHPVHEIKEVHWALEREIKKCQGILTVCQYQPLKSGNEIWQEVLEYLLGIESTMSVLERASSDSRAMRVKWFKKLVAEEKKTAGLAMALRLLHPHARDTWVRHRNNFSIIGIIMLFIVIPVVLATLNQVAGIGDVGEQVRLLFGW